MIPNFSYRAQVWARPPSMEYVPPVIQPAFDDAKNRIKSAISSGSPIRPSGWRRFTPFDDPGVRIFIHSAIW